MAKKKKAKGRKVRVAFKQNRSRPRRPDDWTRRYQDNADKVVDHLTVESVRAKGDLSRKRTIIVDDDETPAADKSQQRRGVVVSAHGLINRVDDESGRIWDCTVRRVLRTILIEQRGSVTVGDRVWFSRVTEPQDGSASVGVIERVDPRSTRLSRRDRRGREHAMVANADQLLIVGSVFEPMVKPHLIDRYIVAALRGDLRPVIVLNKLDLYAGADALDDDDGQGSLTIEELISGFGSLGYDCFATSAVDGEGLGQLRSALQGHMTVLSGQSGVGKSTLINAIQPGLNLSTRSVSDANEKGQHTTSYARLLRLDFGGFVVDTPGIRSFDLWDIDPPELEKYFVEFQPHLDGCQYRDCLHTDEAGCAVIAAVAEGAISDRRYWSYVKMYHDAHHQ